MIFGSLEQNLYVFVAINQNRLMRPLSKVEIAITVCLTHPLKIKNDFSFCHDFDYLMSSVIWILYFKYGKIIMKLVTNINYGQ